MKLNLSKFKKVREDEHTTTLQHPAGHQITIAHKALPKEMHEGLKALPHFAFGGETKQSNPKLEESKKLPHYDDGGEIPAPQADNTPNSSQMPPAPTPSNVASDRPDSEEAIMQDVSNQPVQPSPPSRAERAGSYISDLAHGVAKDVTGGVKKVAGPVVEAAQDFQKGLTQDDNTAQVAQAAVQAAQNPPADVPVALKPNAQPSSNKNPDPSITPPNAPVGQDPFAPAQDPMAPPTLDKAYAEQIMGATGTSKALQDLSIKQSQLQADAAKNEQKSLSDFQSSAKDITDDRQKLIEDINNQHIDPSRLFHNMSTWNKIGSTLGLVAGGLGGALTGHGGNAALDYLNKQVDQDIDAQKAELGKKENLLSANFRRFGDLAQATTMTKLMMADIASNKIASAASAAQNPVEQGRLLTMKGQIDQGMAPAFQSLAMVRALNTSAVQGSDPSSWVRWVVPEQRQAEVFKEIERAQNTRHMGDAITNSFDQATKENTAAKTGFGMVRTPASVYALHQAMQPTFADLEGTVRQAAMDNTFKNITPMPGDTQHTIDTKRAALLDYLKSKSSAPTAKGFNIDLDKFQSTSTNPEARLNDQQQAWAKYARENPGDPRSALMLRKLGLPTHGGQ